MSKTAKRLKEMGVVLPKPAAPVANYVPSVRAGSLLFVSGQLPLGEDGKLAERHQGRVHRLQLTAGILNGVKSV